MTKFGFSLLTLFGCLSLASCSDSGPDSCLAKDFSLNDMTCSLEPLTFERKWESLPILVRANNDLDLEVIDAFNIAFQTEIFRDSEDGIVITLKDYAPSAENALTSISENPIGNIISAHIDIQDITECDPDLYQKILAHQLGHILGAEHLCTSIMNPDIGQIGVLQTELSDDVFIESVLNTYF